MSQPRPAVRLLALARRIALPAFLVWAAGCAGHPAAPRGVSTAPVTAPPPLMARPAFNSPRNVVHIVGPSETLWRISKTYGVDMRTLMAVNHLTDSSKLSNGQKIIV